MPLASISLSSPSASPPSTKSSFLSAFKKNKPVSSFSMAYTISTPRSANAKALQPGLPTVIFLHPVCASSSVLCVVQSSRSPLTLAVGLPDADLSQACFHCKACSGAGRELDTGANWPLPRLVKLAAQFSDPNLRRFNMLAIDLRGHGSSSASLAAIPENYSLTAAAADIIQLMVRSGPTHSSDIPVWLTLFFTRTLSVSIELTSSAVAWARLVHSTWLTLLLIGSSASLRCRRYFRSRCVDPFFFGPSGSRPDTFL